MPSSKMEFPSTDGQKLAARLDMPDGAPCGCAIFAHCFTCTKDILAAKRIATHLSRLGIAVLRFDFTGLGSSEGEFANTSFISNVSDLVAAADHLRETMEAPVLLIGHSLGGAAVLAAAHDIPEAKGVVTIGAPSDAEHVLHTFSGDVERIEREGSAEVTLAGRKFRIGKQFVDAARTTNLLDALPKLKASLLVMHSPIDATVGVENATRIFMAAKHPKSFVSLDTADHLLTKAEDAEFAAEVIAGWASRFLAKEVPQGAEAIEHVRVSETRQSKFQNIVQAGPHRLFADEPASVGGTDTGPSPYDFLSAALGACTSMTLRMYADFKKLSLGAVTVDVSHEKVHARDCADCTYDERAGGGKIDVFERVISVDGEIDPALSQKLEEIAGKCPVHRTLETSAKVRTTVSGRGS
ncbi:alpha/beta fold hydrolase [Oricola sp.]|uniref:bifunctional alpha/beta hydrolase/OsmC family protein n=1 Tax=Oricola sp. TaxID=1979950 RepID=UPI003BAC0557